MMCVGFQRREFCPRSAIAITANFINKQTAEEKEVNEIPGIAALYSRKMFQVGLILFFNA